MSETKKGRFAVAELVAATNTTVYSITNSMDAVVDVVLTNITEGSTFVSLAVVDGLAADIVNADYILKGKNLLYGESVTISNIKMSDDEAIVAYALDSGVIVRVQGVEEDEVGSGRTQELTVTGDVTSGVTSIELNHASVVVEAAIADLLDHTGFLIIKDTSATGTEAHTVTAGSGTFDGTNELRIEYNGEVF